VMRGLRGHHDGLFAHALKDDFGESARTQPASSLHALQDACGGTLERLSGKLYSSMLGSVTAMTWAA
jgi:hypothetical protein